MRSLKATLGLRTGPRNLEEGEVGLEAGLRMRVFDWRILVPLTGVKGAVGIIFTFWTRFGLVSLFGCHGVSDSL